MKDFVPRDSVSVLKLPSLKFDKINKIPYYHNPAKLAEMRRFKMNKLWAELLRDMHAYVSNFGIENFKKEQDMDLLWQMARVAEYLGQVELTKDLYRLIIKHYRGNLQEALQHYDSLIRFEKDLYADISYYYELVERRKMIDTLKPPQDVLVSMDESVNSPFDDYGMSIAGDDNVIYFTSKRAKNPTKRDVIGNQATDENLYFAQKNADGDWEAAKPLDEINTQYNEGSPCMSRDGKFLFFVRCNSKEGFGNCDLYMATRKNDGTWNTAVNMGNQINTNAWESHPSLVASGDTLYFASDRKGGFGGTDIYFALKDAKTGTWGKVQNLGPIINTKDNEVSPFVHPRFNVLYFSSTGQLMNFGDFDIFKTFKIRDQWTEPKNVGPLVNGKGSEFYFSIDAQSKWLFYAKSEGNNQENHDLHSFPLPMEAKPNNIVRFSGVIKEPKTGEVFKGIVSIIDMSDHVEVAPKYVREDGSFDFELINNKKYLLVIEGDNFFNIEEMFFVNGDMEVNIPATSLNSSITFGSIDFELGSSRLLPSMENNLHLLIEFLNKRPEFNVVVVGHTDSDGKPEANLKLSQERAEAIKTFILSYGGFEAARVQAVGMGNTQPIYAKENNEEQKRVNRRVEFKIYHQALGMPELKAPELRDNE